MKEFWILEGGIQSTYIPLLGDRSRFIYESADISPRLSPTYVVNVGEPLPIKDKYFNNIIAFNVLEHIFDVQDTISELHRILKPNGTLYIAVPFLFPIHGAPNDYNRFTAQWWIDTLYKLGFNDIIVDPILWDAFSVGLAVHGGRRKRDMPSRLLSPLPELIRCKLLRLGSEDRYPAYRAAYVSKFAIGYFISAKRT